MSFIISPIKVDNRLNPIGLDVKRPTFQFYIETNHQSWYMKSFQIIVSDCPGLSNILWDSGECKNGEQWDISYKGPQLQSCRTYYWKVIVIEATGEREESKIGFWKTGLMDDSDWKAQWICAGENYNDMPIFRKEFKISKKVKEAAVYISGLGHYELYMNSMKIGDYVLDPGWTNYKKSCFYSAYDVTDNLKDDSIVLGIMLGNGMYHVDGTRYTKFKGSFGKPKFIMQLQINYEDSTTEYITSDESFHYSKSPITFSCVYGGEDYDATLEQKGWLLPNYHMDKSWKPVCITDAPDKNTKLKNQICPPIKVLDEFKPVSVKELSDNKGYLYDFGQNFSGWFEICVTGDYGQQIQFIPSELLGIDGEPDQAAIGSPVYFTYTTNGDGVEKWHPRFTYYGFRYLQVKGAIPYSFVTDNKKPLSVPIINDITGQVLTSNADCIGNFECSVPLFNHIHHIIKYAMLSNMKSVFTDCPHREKLGWLEETHLIAPSILYNFDAINLYKKSIMDMKDSQTAEGLIPSIAPEFVTFDKGFRDSPEWGGACILSPWAIYKRYNNKQILRENYAVMEHYMEYLRSKSDGYMLRHGLGDWLDVGVMRPFAQNTPVPVVASAMYYHLSDIMENISVLLGKKEKAKVYSVLKENIRTQYFREFWNNQVRCISNGSQAAQAMTLCFHMAGEYRERQILDYLIRDIQMRDYHTTAGDVGHPYVIAALIEHNRNDILFKMMSKTDYPSYGQQLKYGATTLCEDWAGPNPEHPAISQNHFMLGSGDSWFYKGLAGIHLPEGEHPQLIKIKPHLTGEVSWLKASHRCVHGDIKVAWTTESNGVIILELTLPPNTDGVLYLPYSKSLRILSDEKPVESQYETISSENFVIIHTGNGRFRFEISGLNL